MLKKPINLITYILSCIFFGYSFNNGVFYLILAIALLFHSFMSCDTIDIRRNP
jgi:hypothetical protein